jgi:hypothetical protein
MTPAGAAGVTGGISAVRLEMEREVEEFLPPPRAVVITLDELFDLEPHRCRTCGVLLDEKFGDVDGWCAAHVGCRDNS